MALFSSVFRVSSGPDPATTLRESCGLVLPSSARVQGFEYEGFLDAMLNLRFEAPKADVAAFLAQKPFAGARWVRNENPFVDADRRRPRAPYRAASIDLPNVRYLRVAVEERGEKPWVVWVQWFTT